MTDKFGDRILKVDRLTKAIAMWCLKKDAHGDVVMTVNGISGTVNTPYEYDAFGNQRYISVLDDNPFRYCGQYFDNESGLIYLRARYYNPKTGRFINEDPIRDGLNWYVYCGNNLVKFVDPSGLGLIANIHELINASKVYSVWDVFYANSYANTARDKALEYAENMGYYKFDRQFVGPNGGYIYNKVYITWENEADALRHMEWNAIMTREMGIEKAKYFADNHEFYALKEMKYVNSVSEYTVHCAINSATLMDLYNNKIGRVLANDLTLKDKSVDELFEYANVPSYMKQPIKSNYRDEIDKDDDFDIGF